MMTLRTESQQLVLDALTIAQDHLAQYRRYSESMRTIGRGCSISSPYQPDTADHIIAAAIREAEAADTPLCELCREPAGEGNALCPACQASR